jgi:hypothetical protein
MELMKRNHTYSIVLVTNKEPQAQSPSLQIPEFKEYEFPSLEKDQLI